ncbi:MAG TPA: NAD-dependent epimerase/dehydratase family protein, partial [Steroidobacteraceae bacterium]|nr:NAD-dependent epimerase/dehydratase family protein [Steroidobacteraceae bacterium]
VVREFKGSIETCIIRISETYGPGDMRLLKLFKGIARQRYLTVGDGKNLHQLVYVDDLSRGLLAAVSAEAARSATIVLAGSEQITTNEMAASIAAAVGRTARIHNVPLWPFTAAASVFEATFPRLGLKPPLHRRRLDFFRKSFRFSTTRARNLLGFAPEVSFAEGARRTAAWYRAAGLL